jgi:hypothetical protein
MNDYLYIYALFSFSSKAIEEGKEQELKLTPYWTDRSLKDRDDMQFERAKKYDRFAKVSHVTWRKGDNDCVSINIEECGNEQALLQAFWDNISLEVFNATPAGWCIFDKVWPRLVNRSLIYGITVPSWAKTDLKKKYSTLNMLDVAYIYKQGVYQGERPLPEIHHALSFWLGGAFPDEDQIRLKACVNPTDPTIEQAACSYIEGMAEIVRRYEQ